MEEKLIAPCGMNCGVCISYQAMKNDINSRGFSKKYCPGCIPRGRHCLHMKDSCEKVGNGLVRFCPECADFPCARLKALDKRYRSKYHMSMLENLKCIQEKGIEVLLENESVKWRCRECGGTICCHNGLCLNCQLETLRLNKKYRWAENDDLNANSSD